MYAEDTVHTRSQLVWKVNRLRQPFKIGKCSGGRTRKSIQLFFFIIIHNIEGVRWVAVRLPARQCQLNWQEGLHAGTAPKAPSERQPQVADSPPIPAGVTLIFISTRYRVN